LLNRGIVQELLDDAGAEEDFKAAIQLNPKDTDAVRRYALSLAEHGKLDEAVTWARKSFELMKTPEAGVFLGALLYDRKGAGDREEAAKICEGLLHSKRGRIADAIEIVVHVRSQQGQGQQAIDLLNKLTEAQLPPVARQTCQSHILLAQQDRE